MATINGTNSNDTYLFGKGDGPIVLAFRSDTTFGKLNTLQFKDGVAVSEVIAQRSGYDLLLSITGTTDQFLVQRFFSEDNPGNRYNELQQIKFADGTTWDLSTIITQAFVGTNADETIEGTIYNDTLDGSAGDDILNGGAGDDTYLFGKGDGQNSLTFLSDTTFGKLNTLQFKAGVAVSEVIAQRSGYDLLLSITGTTDQFLVQRLFSEDNPGNRYNELQQIKFADGTTWDLSTIITQAFVGTNADETIEGTIYNDTLDGSAGNDILNGGAGDDTYLFGKGDGQNTLTFLSDTTFGKLNTLQFKAGVAVSEVIAQRSGYDLLLSITGTTDQFLVQRFFSEDNPGNRYNELQQIKFADGTTWDLNTIAAKAISGNVPGGNTTTNHAPTSANKSVTTSVDTSYAFTRNDFSFVDVDTGAQLQAVQITSLPNAGSLTRNGSPVSVGQSISVADLDAGLLVFAPTANTNGNNYAGFGFKVSDGTLFSDATYQINVDVSLETTEIIGTAVKDNLLGNNDKDDVLRGLAGNDKLQGLSGDDLLDGGTGIDNMRGGAGDDTYIVDHAKDKTIEAANDGTDQVWASVNASLMNNVENLLLLSGSAAKNGTGNALDNLLIGNQNANKLDGKAGNDMIFGNTGNDKLLGGSGNDLLFGEAGNDNLNGGSGNDTFGFSTGAGQDVIKNFGDKGGHQDLIDLSDFNVSFDNLQITSKGKSTVISIDTVSANDFQITLTGVKAANIGADDFAF